jgi:hypothetical protein
MNHDSNNCVWLRFADVPRVARVRVQPFATDTDSRKVTHLVNYLSDDTLISNTTPPHPLHPIACKQ